MSEYMLDVEAIRKAPVGRVATLSADLFNGPDPVPGIEVELPLEQVKASTIGADVALVAPADLAALCDEVDALCDEVAAKDVENERLRAALKFARDIADAADDVDIFALDALDAMLADLADGRGDGMSGHPRPPIPFGPRCSFWGCVEAATRYVGRWSFCDDHGGAS